MNRSCNLGILIMAMMEHPINVCESSRSEEALTTVGTFYNGARLELSFGHSADARRPLIVHVLVG